MVGRGDDLLPLLGRPSDEPGVQAALARLARGMQPDPDPDDEEERADWVTVNEIGLEFGFEDDAYVRALHPQERGQRLLLTQICFFGETELTRPYPAQLPFGLDFGDDRDAVRAKLGAFEPLRRSYVRDAWRLPAHDLTIAYRASDGRLESVLCALPYVPWPESPGEVDLVAPFTPDFFASLFGERWSSPRLRTQLMPVGYGSRLADVRSEHAADLRFAHGLELGFSAGENVPAADARHPKSLCLATASFYGPRVFDASRWLGEMPLDLSFEDSQVDIARKFGRRPDDRGDLDREGFVVLHLPRYTLRAQYSNIENRLLKATIMAPGYWERSGAGDRDDDESNDADDSDEDDGAVS